MARVTPSGIISDIRGQFNGGVFQHTQGGLILRNKDIKCNRNTISQNGRRNLSAYLLSAWMNLTEAQRQEWNAFKAYYPIQQKNNQFRFLDGQQTFYRCNYYRLAYNKTLLESPVWDIYLGTQVTSTLIVSSPVLAWSISDNAMSTYSFGILYLTAPVPQSVNNPSNRLRLIPFTTIVGDAQDISAGYVAAFGRLPVVGEFVLAKWTLQNKDGCQLLPWVNDQIEVEAP